MHTDKIYVSFDSNIRQVKPHSRYARKLGNAICNLCRILPDNDILWRFYKFGLSLTI